MRVTLLGVLGFVALVALLGYVVYELNQAAQNKKDEPPHPNSGFPPEIQ